MPSTLRTERFGLTLSESERQGLRYLAEIEGLAEADVLRRLLRLAINDLPVDYKQSIGWDLTRPRNLLDMANRG